MGTNRDFFFGLMVGALFLNLWYLAYLAIEGQLIPTSFDRFLNAIVILFAAFLGAYCAYLLAEKKEVRKLEREKIKSLNTALFVSLRQLNAMLHIKNLISPWEADEYRFINMPAMLVGSYEDLKLDLNALDFLLEEDDPNLLFEISIEQERFESTVSTFEIRNKIHYEKIQTALDIPELVNTNLTLKKIIDVLGKKQAGSAKKCTDDTFRHVYENYESMRFSHYKLFNTAKRLFPGQEFIRFEPEASEK